MNNLFNNVEVRETGIKCDNPSCDYKDESVKHEELKGMINTPCPQCGENLLTEEDYNNANQVMMLVELMNTFSPVQLESIASIMGIDTSDTNNDLYSGTIETHKEISVTNLKKLNNEQKVKGSDTTDDASSTDLD